MEEFLLFDMIGENVLIEVKETIEPKIAVALKEFRSPAVVCFVYA